VNCLFYLCLRLSFISNRAITCVNYVIYFLFVIKFILLICFILVLFFLTYVMLSIENVKLIYLKLYSIFSFNPSFTTYVLVYAHPFYLIFSTLSFNLSFILSFILFSIFLFTLSFILIYVICVIYAIYFKHFL
jgi:hypothetical protein